MARQYRKQIKQIEKAMALNDQFGNELSPVHLKIFDHINDSSAPWFLADEVPEEETEFEAEKKMPPLLRKYQEISAKYDEITKEARIELSWGNFLARAWRGDSIEDIKRDRKKATQFIIESYRDI